MKQKQIALIVTAAIAAISAVASNKDNTFKLKSGPLSADVDIYDIQIDKTAPGVRHFGVTSETGYQEITLVDFGDAVLVVTQQVGQEEKRQVLNSDAAKALMISFGAMFKGEQEQPAGAVTAMPGKHSAEGLHLVDLKKRKAA